MYYLLIIINIYTQVIVVYSRGLVLCLIFNAGAHDNQ